MSNTFISVKTASESSVWPLPSAAFNIAFWVTNKEVSNAAPIVITPLTNSDLMYEKYAVLTPYLVPIMAQKYFSPK